MTELDPLSETTIAPTDAYAANRANWDDRATVHAASRAYDLDGLVADPSRISSVIAEDVELLRPHLPAGAADSDRPLAGLDVCHLQCHIGTDTLSLARLGGHLTGVDLSPQSLAIARDVAARAGMDIRYVEAEVTAAAPAVAATFDHVHTSIGTICWLQDLTGWARTVADLLRPGGTFFFRDQHPILATLDDTVSDAVVPGYRYFAMPPGHAWTYADGITYTDGDTSQICARRNYEWPHPVAEILQALLDAGLELVAIGEHDRLPWQALPLMVAEDGAFVLPSPWRDRVPLALSLVARKR